MAVGIIPDLTSRLPRSRCFWFSHVTIVCRVSTPSTPFLIWHFLVYVMLVGARRLSEKCLFCARSCLAGSATSALPCRTFPAPFFKFASTAVLGCGVISCLLFFFFFRNRHKYTEENGRPALTPDGFWDLSFADSPHSENSRAARPGNGGTGGGGDGNRRVAGGDNDSLDF